MLVGPHSVAVLIVCLCLLSGVRSDDYAKLKAALRAKHAALLQASKPKTIRTDVQKPTKPVESSAGESSSFNAGESSAYGSNAATVSIDTSSRAWSNGQNIADRFYELAMSTHNESLQFQPIQKLHLIRVPKASSSSLSAVARRAVGCEPPGPCCHYPGEPRGSCPSKDMFRCQEEKRVIGCTDHFPYLGFLFNAGVPSISTMRNPFSRSISGFFYPGIHHNADCTGDIHECFVEYTRNPKWQNIVVKMLTGDHAYSPSRTCRDNPTCLHSLQLALTNLRRLTFMGVAEMWELSLLVLHHKLPMLPPSLAEFRMGTEENSITKGNRVNMKAGYAEFRATALEKYQRELEQQNSLDAALYRVVVSNMCDDLHNYGLWQHEMVRTYWKAHAPYVSEKCV